MFIKGGGLGDSSKDDELMKKYLTKDEAEGLQVMFIARVR